jgi:hypothetical protein
MQCLSLALSNRGLTCSLCFHLILLIIESKNNRNELFLRAALQKQLADVFGCVSEKPQGFIVLGIARAHCGVGEVLC